MPRPLLIALVILISIAWAINLTVGYLHIAETEPSVNAIFALIVGALFPLVRKGRKGTTRDGDDAP